MSKNHDASLSRKRSLSRRKHEFRVEKSFLKMPDGARLAATYYIPLARSKKEKFPVLLEILPYRKDDTFYLADYPTYSYLAQRGFITVKVDIRGTGGSTGGLPEREYSDIELDDAEEVIRQLAARPDSNGSVGMWGVSWSAFNSLMVAARRPEALKAILVMHSSVDLFYDDLHYIDGVLHLDPYHLYINHENGLPSTPNYRLDRKYFTERFERRPWIYQYLKRQTDCDFYRDKSISEDYSRIDIPVYAIGGLLDGYRDSVPRLLENLSAPVRAEIGPWNHSCPDDGMPGPNYEWHDEAVAWFRRYLNERPAKSDDSVDALSRKLTVFVRDGDNHSETLERMSGKFREVKWPMPGMVEKRFYLSTAGNLTLQPGKSGVHSISSAPADGTPVGTWWGDSTGNIADESESAVHYDRMVEKPLCIVGFPAVSLEVASDNPGAFWSIRLEDVAPDGTVSLVTGALVNGYHLNGRDAPQDLEPGAVYRLEKQLHFTTWTFKPGHRIRLSVGNSQFPMAWPSQYVPSTKLLTGNIASRLDLPVVQKSSLPVKKSLASRIRRKLEAPDAEHLSLEEERPEHEQRWNRKISGGMSEYAIETNSAYRIKGRKFKVGSLSKWCTSEKQPWRSSYTGRMFTEIKSCHRKIRLITEISILSSRSEFRLRVKRVLELNGKRIRQKQWSERIPRIFQ